MGIDVVLLQTFLAKYGPELEKLYDDDYEKFKKLFQDLQQGIQTAAKLTAGQITADMVNRKFFLDLMSTVNTKKHLEKYLETSNDLAAKFLTHREDQVSSTSSSGIILQP